MSSVKKEYQSRMDALPGHERVSRAAAMLAWTREMIARQIVAEKGDMPDQRLKWEVALRLYGADPQVHCMIESKLADVSR